MSYTLHSNCGNCDKKINCKDYETISKAITEIHSNSHIGFGNVKLNCFNNKKSDNLNFGEAISFMKQGLKMARKSWLDKDMFINIQDKCIVDKGSKWQWLASQDDMLNNDWYIVN